MKMLGKLYGKQISKSNSEYQVGIALGKMLGKL